MTKIPPIEKIYEAWSAIADGRVTEDVENKFRIVSSDGDKVYTVIYNPKDDVYASNDNATFWQGYAGYPVIAVMMLKGQLPLYPSEMEKWGNINWHELNDKHKRDYAAAVLEVEEIRGIDISKAAVLAEQILEFLKESNAKVKRLTGIPTK